MTPRRDTSKGYAIIANPVSGNLPKDQKGFVLAGAARILDAGVYGLDTRTPAEFDACARQLAGRCDVIVAAGGDGTFSQVINTVDTTLLPWPRVLLWAEIAKGDTIPAAA